MFIFYLFFYFLPAPNKRRPLPVGSGGCVAGDGRCHFVRILYIRRGIFRVCFYCFRPFKIYARSYNAIVVGNETEENGGNTKTNIDTYNVLLLMQNDRPL